MNRDIVNIVDITSEFEGTPWVNYQCDQYMGVDGARYEVIEHPTLVDALGIMPLGGHGESKGIRPTDPDEAGTSKVPGTSKGPLDDLFADLHWEDKTKETRGKSKVTQ